jgi:alanine racemase
MVNGDQAAVVGRVSMNLITVNVSGIGGVVEGTEAVLLGEGVSAEDHAQWAGTIPYEILCGVRAPRVLR